MVKALRSCLEAARENQGRSLDPQKKPQENSYRIFYSLKYIPYTHSTCRIYSLLVPGILESRMSQETASVLGNSYRIYSLKYIPYTHSTCRHGLARYWQSPSFEGEIVPKIPPVLSKAPEQGLDYL